MNRALWLISSFFLPMSACATAILGVLWLIRGAWRLMPIVIAGVVADPLSSLFVICGAAFAISFIIAIGARE